MADAPDTPARRSPLAHRSPIESEGGAIRIAERPFFGKIVLRVDATVAADILLGAVGMSLPTTPLTSATAREASLLWLGPDEWMLVTPPEQAAAALADARAALAGIHHQLVAVGDYYTIIEIAGPMARAALMKLTTLDLHPRVFKTGAVCGSMFGRTQATLWQVRDEGDDGGAVFRLIVRWSMADYLWCLLANAGREFGLPPQELVKGEKLTIA